MGEQGQRSRRESVAVIDAGGADLTPAAQNSELVLPVYSITKTYIAACMFAAGVDVSRKVADWFGAELVPRGGDITVHQLLNHSSGLPDYGAEPEYQAAVQEAVLWDDGQFADLTLRRDLLFEPGHGWAYSNPGYWLLGQILQRVCDLDLAACVEKFVCRPLGLQQTAVVTGQFADDLPHYPAAWVWHGLICSTAAEVVQFMRSPLVTPLLQSAGQVPVPVEHPSWREPRWGYGLMFDHQRRYGHNGDGPGYSAACYQSLDTGVTACVLCAAEQEGVATTRVLQLLE